MDDPEDDGWTEELVNELFASEEWTRVDSLSKDVIDRIGDAVDRGVEEEELADAFKDVLNETSNADSTAGEYLFQSNANAADYAEEVGGAYDALKAAYPLLINDDPDDVVDPVFGDLNASGSGTCEVTDQTIDDFFANFDAINEQQNGSNLQVVDCNSWWKAAKLAACFAGVLAGAAAGLATPFAPLVMVAGATGMWMCACAICYNSALC